MWDVFISHASEDKNYVARPLSVELGKIGIKSWLDENELQIGDSLREKIEQGLSLSRYGVVILSNSFFSKKWTRRELDALFSLEDGDVKKILPIWYNISHKEIAMHSPILADRIAAIWSEGVEVVAKKIYYIVRKDKADSEEERQGTYDYFRDLKWEKIKENDYSFGEDKLDEVLRFLMSLDDLASMVIKDLNGIILSRALLYLIADSTIKESESLRKMYGVTSINSIKKSAIIAKWILRLRPLQIAGVTDSDITKAHLLANENYALFIILGYNHIDFKKVALPSEYVEAIFRGFRYESLDTDSLTLRIQLLLKQLGM